MTHMDGYTILFQAKHALANEKDLDRLLNENLGVQMNKIIDQPERYTEEIRNFTLKYLEQSVKTFRYEFPPSVCKRMEKYYEKNKDALVDVFYNKVKEVLSLD